MKILYVTDSFAPESVGGAGQVALDMARGMLARGHTVTVLTTTQYRDRVGTGTFEEIPVVRLYSSQKSFFARAYLSANNPFIRTALLSAVKEVAPDIVHAHNIHEHFSFAALRWTKALGIPVFITLHDTLSFSYTRLYHFIHPFDKEQRPPFKYALSWWDTIRQVGKAFNPFRKWSIQTSLQSAQTVFVVSRALQDALKQNGISKTEVLYNGVTMNDFHADQNEIASLRSELGCHDRPVILFGGRALQDKGSEVIIDAMAERVVEKCPEALVVMAIEKSPHGDALLRYAAQKKVSHNIMCIDLMHGKRRAALFSLADVVVVPSIYFDPAPLMVMQAMASAKPVIGTCFGGTPEIIEDGITGFIVNPFHTILLGDKILEIIQNPEKKRRMGDAALLRVQQLFSLHKHIDHALAAYGKALIKGA